MSIHRRQTFAQKPSNNKRVVISKPKNQPICKSKTICNGFPQWMQIVTWKTLENLQNCIFFQANDLFKVFHCTKRLHAVFTLSQRTNSPANMVCVFAALLLVCRVVASLLMIMITSSLAILNLQSHKIRGKMCCSSSPGHSLGDSLQSVKIARSTIHMSFAAGANTVFSITIITHVGVGKIS